MRPCLVDFHKKLLKFFSKFLLLICFCCFSFAVLANNLLTVNSTTNNSEVQIILDFKSYPHYKIFKLTAPDRLAIDINDCSLAKNFEKSSITNSLIKNVRFGKHENNSLRIVFDLNAPISYSSKITDSKLKIFLKSDFVRNQKVSESPQDEVIEKQDNSASYVKEDIVANKKNKKEVGISFSPKTVSRKTVVANETVDLNVRVHPKEPGISFSPNKNAKNFVANRYVAMPQQNVSNVTFVEDYHQYLLNNKSMNLSSNDFGWSLPLTLGYEYSSNFGSELNGNFASSLGFSNAVAAQFDAGKNEYRLNATFGHAFTDHQRLKFTGEYLAQNMDFDFKAGPVTNWVGQGAFGGTYEYLFPQRLLHDINLNAFYSKAWSKDLGYVVFDDPTNLETGLSEDWRRIAGATDKSASLGLDLMPFKTTLFGAQMNFDDVKYDMRYPITPENPDPSASGMGGTLTLEQLLGKRLKLKLLGSMRKIYNDYTAELDLLALSNSDHHLEFALTSEHIANNRDEQSSGIVHPIDNRFGLSLTYKFGDGFSHDKDNSYTLDVTDTHSDLTGWVANPAVRMAKVLAVKDEMIRQILLPTIQNGSLMSCVWGSPCAFDLNQYISFGADKLTDIENQKIIAQGLEDFETLANYGLHFELVDDGHHAVLVGTPTRETKGEVHFSADGYITAPVLSSPIPVVVSNFAGSTAGTLMLNVGAINPVINAIKPQTFVFGNYGSVDLAPYITFGAESLTEVHVVSPSDLLGQYGLSIDMLSDKAPFDGKHVWLYGIPFQDTPASGIPVQINVVNSANKTSNTQTFNLIITPQPADEIIITKVAKQYHDTSSNNLAATISNASTIASIEFPGVSWPQYGFTENEILVPGSNTKQIFLYNAAPLTQITPLSGVVQIPIKVKYLNGDVKSDNMLLEVKAKAPVITPIGPASWKYKTPLGSAGTSAPEVATVNMGGANCAEADGISIDGTNSEMLNHGLQYTLESSGGQCYVKILPDPISNPGPTSSTVENGFPVVKTATFKIKNDPIESTVNSSFDYSIDAIAPTLAFNKNIEMSFESSSGTIPVLQIADPGGDTSFSSTVISPDLSPYLKNISNNVVGSNVNFSGDSDASKIITPSGGVTVALRVCNSRSQCTTTNNTFNLKINKIAPKIIGSMSNPDWFYKTALTPGDSNIVQVDMGGAACALGGDVSLTELLGDLGTHGLQYNLLAGTGTECHVIVQSIAPGGPTSTTVVGSTLPKVTAQFSLTSSAGSVTSPTYKYDIDAIAPILSSPVGNPLQVLCTPPGVGTVTTFDNGGASVGDSTCTAIPGAFDLNVKSTQIDYLVKDGTKIPHDFDPPDYFKCQVQNARGYSTNYTLKRVECAP